MTTETTTDPGLAIGILSLSQAAEILKVEPLAVQRLVALKLLLNNRNSKGVVVLKNDLDRYIGAGSQRLAMPPNRGDWFTDSEGFMSRSRFFQSMKRSSVGIAEVTDRQVSEAYKKQQQTRDFASELRFFVKPTAAMRQQYQALAGELFSSPNPYSVGVSAIAGAMRAEVKNQLNKQSVTGFQTKLWRLYDTPRDFQAIIDKARDRINESLNVQFRELRVLEGGVQRTIVRVVRLADLSSNLARDVSQAVDLAF